MAESFSGKVITTGVSAESPSLAAYAGLGAGAAWNDSSGQIWLAFDGSEPSYAPTALNPDFKTQHCPALAFCPATEALLLAWTDSTGTVNVSSSADGWRSDRVQRLGVSDNVGPTLLVVDAKAYLTYTQSGLIATTVFQTDFSSVSDIQTGTRSSSRVSSCEAAGRLYFGTGSAEDGSGDPTLRIYRSDDGAVSLSGIPVPSVRAFGPPSLAFVDGLFHVVWMDFDSGELCYAKTQDLASFSPTRTGERCHGGPSVAASPDRLMVGWSVQSPPEDASAHHVAVAQVSLPANPAEMEKATEILTANRAKRAKADPDCRPFGIWDPVQKTCVEQGSCWARCVLKSGNPLFGINPIAYAVCVAACTAHS